MEIFELPNGRRFVARKWHDVEIRTIPRLNDALARCRACGVVRALADEVWRSDANSQRIISQVAQRLRCSSCGEQQADLLVGYYAGEPPAL